MNKASSERELDSIENRAGRIRTAQATACGSDPHRESRQVLGHGGTPAKMFLRQLEAKHARHVADRDRLFKPLAKRWQA
jgi:hypothetical protein